MAKMDDFASLMEESLATGTSRAKRRLKQGEVVEGTIIQISTTSSGFFTLCDDGTVWGLTANHPSWMRLPVTLRISKAHFEFRMSASAVRAVGAWRAVGTFIAGDGSS